MIVVEFGLGWTAVWLLLIMKLEWISFPSSNPNKQTQLNFTSSFTSFINQLAFVLRFAVFHEIKASSMNGIPLLRRNGMSWCAVDGPPAYNPPTLINQSNAIHKLISFISFIPSIYSFDLNWFIELLEEKNK